MTLRTGALAKWWPTTQSLDLVEGDARVVAAAVEKELRRFLRKEMLVADWVRFSDLDTAFASAAEFAGVPTYFLVLPTKSRWSALWNNIPDVQRVQCPLLLSGAESSPYGDELVRSRGANDL